MADYRFENVPDGTIVKVPPEFVQACRVELIKVAQAQTTITLGGLFDAMLASTGGGIIDPRGMIAGKGLTTYEMPERTDDDSGDADWVIWLYGLLQLVGDDCRKRGEPLLPSLVTKEDGSVW